MEFPVARTLDSPYSRVPNHFDRVRVLQSLPGFTFNLVFVVSWRSCTNRAKQRTPLPHCSTSEPSALKITLFEIDIG